MNYQTVGSNPNSFALIDAQSIPRELEGEKAASDTAMSLFDVILPSLASFTGFLFWSLLNTDGTDAQAFCGIASISAVNKAGSYTSSVVELAGIQSKSVSSGTLTEAVSIVTGTNKITIVITPTGSLTETTYRLTYKLLNLSKQQITVLP